MNAIRNTCLVVVALVLTACSTVSRDPGPAISNSATRRFHFPEDTVGFANETRWMYRPTPDGRGMTHEKRDPPPTYSLRCFVVARLNRQFFDHAEFAPSQPRADATRLRALVREIVHRSPRRSSPAADRVVIPGFGNLRELSETHAPLLQELGGPAFDSYAQRGHWRMVFPLGRRRESREAQRIFNRVESGRPALVHLVRFPQLTINHAVLVFDGHRTADGFEFLAADPNDPSRVSTLTFTASDGRFTWPATLSFIGGRVDVYEIFRSAWY